MSQNNNDSVSRRSFVATSLASVALAGTAAHAAEKKKTPMTNNKKRRKMQIGLQLYSVRKDCAKDLAGTIAAVAKMGYMGVEFAGYHDKSAKEIRKMLDDNGIVCCGTHTGLDTLLGDNLKKTIEFNKTIGNRFLVVPSLPEKYRA